MATRWGLREAINRYSRLPIPAVFDWLIKVVIPLAIATLLASSIWSNLQEGLYGDQLTLDWGTQLPLIAFFVWIVGSLGGAVWLARQPQAQETGAEVADAG